MILAVFWISKTAKIYVKIKKALRLPLLAMLKAVVERKSLNSLLYIFNNIYKKYNNKIKEIKKGALLIESVRERMKNLEDNVEMTRRSIVLLLFILLLKWLPNLSEFSEIKTKLKSQY